MSRSRKKPIVKDKNAGMKKLRHRKVRHKVKQQLGAGALYEEELAIDKEVLNDYDVCDYVCDLSVDYKHTYIHCDDYDSEEWWEEERRKATRK